MNVTQQRTFGHKSTKRLLLAPSNDGRRKTYLFDFKKVLLTYLILEKISTTYYVLSENTDTITLFIELIGKYQISTSNLLDL